MANGLLTQLLEPLLTTVEERNLGVDPKFCGSWELSCRLASASKQWQAAVREYRLQQRAVRLAARNERRAGGRDYTRLDAYALLVLARDCPNLRHLTIAGRGGMDGHSRPVNLDEKALADLARLCGPKLETLRFEAGAKAPAESLLEFARCCPQLKSFHATWPMPACVVLTLITGCNAIRSIKIDSSSPGDWLPSHLKLVVDRLAELPQLEQMYLTGLSPTLLAGTTWPRLSELSLREARPVSSRVFTDFSCPRVATLDLSGCYAGGQLRDLASCFPTLESVVMRRFPLCDSYLDGLAHPTIRRLDLGDNGTPGADLFTGRCLTAQALPSLRELVLNHSVAVDEALELDLPQLRSLDLFATEIDDGTVARLVRSCPTLESLCIGCNDNITDESAPLLASLASLTNLNLCSCAISDTAVPHLAALPRLAVLDLDGCGTLTDDGLLQLVQTCTAHVALGSRPLRSDRGPTFFGFSDGTD